MRKLPVISIVVLNWNSIQDTLELLASVYKSNYPKSKYEVIIVDNGSTDGSVKKIKSAYPKTRIFSLKQNIGVSARNKGFKYAQGEIIVTLDSDATIGSNTLTAIAKKIRDDPSIGILGVKILNKKTLTPEFSPMHVDFFTGMVSTLNSENATTNATFLPFICSAIPKKNLKKIGLLDKAFFFYGEDFDFCMRIKKNGLKVVYYPDISAYHGKNKTISAIPHLIVYHHYYKGLFRNIYKYGNFIQKLSTSFFQLVLIPFYRLLIRRENTFAMRWWGFWWNMKHLEKETKIFIFVFLIGLILRLFAIDKRDFWFDEAFTYHIAKLPLPELLQAVLTDNNPPLYYLLIHFVLRLSSNEIILRLPSVIANIAVMVLLYATLKKFINRKVGLIVSALFALSPLTIYIATEARLHSLAMLMAVLLMSLFLKLIKKREPLIIAMFIFVANLGLYTQYYIALLFLPFTWIVLRYKTNLTIKSWVIIFIGALATLTPWLFLSALASHNVCSCPSTFLSLPSSLVSPILGGIGEVTFRSFPTLPIPIFLLFAATALIYLFLFLKGIAQNRSITFIYLIPLGILSLLGLFFTVFSPKAFAIFSPIYFAIVAIGITSYRKLVIILLIILGLLGTISITQLTLPFFAGTKLKPIDKIIQQNRTITVAHTSTLTYYPLSFYSKNTQKHMLVTPNPLSPQTLHFIGGQTSNVNTRESLWLVDSEKWTDARNRKNALKTISDVYYVVKTYKIDKISVSLLKQK